MRATLLCVCVTLGQPQADEIPWVVVAKDKQSFVLEPSGKTSGDAVMLAWLEYYQKTITGSIAPVSFAFKRKCGPAEGRKEAFDAKTQTYYLHVHDIARFEIKGVAPDLDKRMVVLKITGMLDKPEGPLTLYVPDKGGKNKAFKLSHQSFAKELFLIDRKDGVTTIEFLPAGRRLLRPGAWFQYVDFFRN